ncbi:hypothetical protein [Candidatus Spongiihabitans sp.]|uniref:hypothetical protein n=1 Tax=Candidatus Spongiihabitans sp. TaxID=3101308 RepID=UPI003C7D54F4
MKNDYALATQKGLMEIVNRLKSASKFEIDELRQLLRIGIQWNTEVTIADSRQQYHKPIARASRIFTPFT